jgi:transposase
VPENLSLVFLPPYSPDLNPIERLWRKHPARAVMGIHQAAAAGISRAFQFQGSSSCSREAG